MTDTAATTESKIAELRENVQAIGAIARSAYDDTPEGSPEERTARAVLLLSDLVHELIKIEHIRVLMANYP